MFYALAENLIDTGDLEFVHELQDIETLNRRALSGELEVTAVSIHAYAYLADRYALLPHGASMGEGYGPRLVARDPLQPATCAAARRRARHADLGVPRLRMLYPEWRRRSSRSTRSSSTSPRAAPTPG
jgi:predicted solute-binding protein